MKGSILTHFLMKSMSLRLWCTNMHVCQIRNLKKKCMDMIQRLNSLEFFIYIGFILITKFSCWNILNKSIYLIYYDNFELKLYIITFKERKMTVIEFLRIVGIQHNVLHLVEISVQQRSHTNQLFATSQHKECNCTIFYLGLVWFPFFQNTFFYLFFSITHSSIT